MPHYNDYNKLTPGYRYEINGVTNGCYYGYYGTTTKRYGHVVTPFMNEISNGVLRMTADFRAPSYWEAISSFIAVAPVFRSQLDMMAWNGSGTTQTAYATVGRFGVGSSDNDTKKTLSLQSLFNATKRFGTYYNYNAKYAQHWVRFVIDYDLEAKTFGGSVYDVGAVADPPRLDTDNGKVIATIAPSALLAEVTPDNPLAGIDLGGVMGAANSGSVTNKVFVDNLKCEWKRPGSDTFASFYENDFETRRYRVICGPSATAAAYPQRPVVGSVTNRFHGYPSSAANDWNYWGIVPTLVSDGKVPQPIGVDGWRRVGFDSYNYGYCPVNSFYYNKVGDTNKKLALTIDKKSNSIAQPLGRRVTTGKVRFRASVRTPDMSFGWFNKPDYCRIYAMLGDEDLYEATTQTLASRYAVMGGIQYTAEAGATNRYPYCETPGGRITDTAHNLDIKTWYHLDLTADIDSQTYDIALYPISTNLAYNAELAPIGEAIVSQRGLPFMNADKVKGIASFVINGFGRGSSWTLDNCQRYTWWDNIQVDVISPDGAATNMVYYNDFDERIRVTEQDGSTSETPLASQFDRDDGPDHWWWSDINNLNVPYPVVTGGTEAHLKMTSDGAVANQVMQSFGKTLTEGVYLVDAVMRPPAYFMDSSGCAYLQLGDERFLQGRRTNVAAENSHNRILARFGFYHIDGEGTASNSLLRVRMALQGYDLAAKTTKAVIDGTAIDATHWFRFVARVDLDRQRISLKAYDLGAEHPTAASPRGELVATWDEVGYYNEPQGGFAAIGFRTYGMCGDDSTPECANALLVDSVEVRRKPGSVIFVR